ncbi:MAG: SEC59/DGK1/VTE5 family protein [Candidatus Bathyarchaeota archaeon]|nr:SEC59/DGK1/VTE5 family protein [Candidatus Bathyarchaeota archaeon]
MIFCYVYIVLIVIISNRIWRASLVSRKSSRKFLHAMIGNLPFIIPFFSANFYPVIVAAPFILITILASPRFPYPRIRSKLKGLAEISREGHPLGLVFYAISYTILAFLFGSQPYIVAAGVLPMAYGDSGAAIIGERYGRRKFKLFSEKSLEGSAAMFLISFSTLTVSLLIFSSIHSFSVSGKIPSIITVCILATLVESLSPEGFDNLTVPLSSAVIFLLTAGEF